MKFIKKKNQENSGKFAQKEKSLETKLFACVSSKEKDLFACDT